MGNRTRRHNVGFKNDSGKAVTLHEKTLARDSHREAIHERRKKQWAKKQWFLKNVPFECQLYRGTGKFPQPTKMMTCKQMGLENKKFIVQYGAAIKDNPNAALWSWKFVDLENFKKVRDEHVYNG